MVARLKKKYFIIIILFFLLFVFGIFLLNTQNPKLIQIKRYIPTEIKDFLKDTIFYIPSVIKLIGTRLYPQSKSTLFSPNSKGV